MSCKWWLLRVSVRGCEWLDHIALRIICHTIVTERRGGISSIDTRSFLAAPIVLAHSLSLPGGFDLTDSLVSGEHYVWARVESAWRRETYLQAESVQNAREQCSVRSKFVSFQYSRGALHHRGARFPPTHPPALVCKSSLFSVPQMDLPNASSAFFYSLGALFAKTLIGSNPFSRRMCSRANWFYLLQAFRVHLNFCIRMRESLLSRAVLGLMTLLRRALSAPDHLNKRWVYVCVCVRACCWLAGCCRVFSPHCFFQPHSSHCADKVRRKRTLDCWICILLTQY